VIPASVINSNLITASMAAHAAGTVDIAVTNPNGVTARKAGAFTYSVDSVMVTAVSPASGLTDGGTKLTIRGTGFRHGTSGVSSPESGTRVTLELSVLSHPTLRISGQSHLNT